MKRRKGDKRVRWRDGEMKGGREGRSDRRKR